MAIRLMTTYEDIEDVQCVVVRDSEGRIAYKYKLVYNYEEYQESWMGYFKGLGL